MNSISLSPFDYIFTGAGSQPITFAFYFPEKQRENKLKSTLEESLRHFTVLKSRLKNISETDSVFEICDDGITFEVHHLDFNFDKKDNIKKYISPVKTTEENPLTKVSLTHTLNGSVLAVSISHALVDGFSYFHFLSSWARISRGEKFIPPHIERDLFSEFIKPLNNKITNNDLLTNCGLFYGNKRTDNETSANDRIFIPFETIKEISEQARNKNIFLTENDVITGMLWKKFLIDWNKNGSNPETYLTFPFDFRRALNGFPKNYFGCAVVFGTAKLSLEELAEKPEEEIAAHVKSSVSKIKNEYVRNAINVLENFRTQSGRDQFEKLHLRHPESGIIITNISKLPVRDLDFGNGVPTEVLTYAEVTRSAAILPAPGGVEILAASPVIY